ncbi:hypothetical protein [Actinoplanes sp. NPDC049265]|uniref:hypothetical protein n=1 Tax=Actinoplanes sp. NPDC049265 TaxID=3363902 RepID=UPI00371126C9
MSADAGGIEMFFVRAVPGHTDEALDAIAEHTAALGGVVLLSTAGGGLVVGLPPGRKEALQAHSLVGFAGGVSFADDAPGLRVLRQRFALNAARQLAERGRTGLTDAIRPGTAASPAETPWSRRLTDPRHFLSSDRRESPENAEGNPA